jgi:Effector Associated Constant Component 1
MPKDSNVKLTIAFNDPELDLEEKEDEVQKLLAQLKDLDEVETVSRVLDPNPPEGNKALGGILVGLLSAEVSPANLKTLFGFLSDRLGQKPIELEVEANGKKLKVTAHSREELEAAIKAAQDFVGVLA